MVHFLNAFMKMPRMLIVSLLVYVILSLVHEIQFPKETAVQFFTNLKSIGKEKRERWTWDGGGSERERVNDPVCWFALQMSTAAGAGLGLR